MNATRTITQANQHLDRDPVCPACRATDANSPSAPNSLSISSDESIRLRLNEKLLAIDGTHVACMGADPDAERIVAAGQLFDCPVRLKRGRAHRCHVNAARLWARDPHACRLMTGYALSGGCWRSHSWVAAGGRILETTTKAERYFGIALTDAEALDFFCDNVVDPEYPRAADVPPGYFDAFPEVLTMLQAHAVNRQESGTPAASIDRDN
jgi:hypothetical protein